MDVKLPLLCQYPTLECQFDPVLLPPQRSLLAHLGKQRKMAQTLGPRPSMRETQEEFRLPASPSQAPDVGAILEVSQLMDDLSLSFSITLSNT